MSNGASLSTVVLAGTLTLMSCGSTPHTQVDVLIIGGGASGVSAAVQASRMGATVFVAEESTWLGGMLTGAGVSAVDGNYRMPAGLFGEFRERLEAHYGGPEALKTGWVSSILFEPSVGDSIFKSMVGAESNISVAYNAVPTDVKRLDNGWTATFENSDGKKFIVDAKVVIDGTELGDVAKQVGIKYDIGMESRDITGEDIAPEQSNGIIQDLTMVAILKDYGRDVTIDEPEDYDPDEFACTAINDLCVNPKQPNRMWPVDKMITYGKLPNGKYMINWPIEGNDYFVNIIEMNREQRDSAIAEAKAHTMRYIYFMQKELGLNTLGLADDEFPTDDLLPFLPYHRESRRIHGKVRFDLNHIMSPYDTAEPLYRTTIAVGDYPVDHHHHAYDGVEDLPNLYFHPVPSFGLPLGVIIPDSVENMLVTEKSISVSNIVNGTTRLQPVVVQLGQAAGALAAIAARDNVDVSDVSVRDVQSAILDAGGYLLPYLDVEKNDPAFKPYQRIGATGILRGDGRSISWRNETWLRAADPLKAGELNDFADFYGVGYDAANDDAEVTVAQVAELINTVNADINVADCLKNLGIDKHDSDVITRGEFALLVDSALNPFSRDVTVHGLFVDFE
ncbi:MAG: FAD-dependent oxidoreductase [Bacteroides sp.]|nr:FAD-dependent oxidoreductase [Bacteroides sp.]